jgi:hypothetical protein
MNVSRLDCGPEVDDSEWNVRIRDAVPHRRDQVGAIQVADTTAHDRRLRVVERPRESHSRTEVRRIGIVGLERVAERSKVNLLKSVGCSKLTIRASTSVVGCTWTITVVVVPQAEVQHEAAAKRQSSWMNAL